MPGSKTMVSRVPKLAFDASIAARKVPGDPSSRTVVTTKTLLGLLLRLRFAFSGTMR